MDNIIRGVSPSVITRPEAQPQAKLKVNPVSQVSQPQPVEKTENVEAVRVKELARAASQYQADPYVVSDRTFTIFKDASGQYIVRYRSLRDGKITYVPEPAIMPYQIQNAGRGSLIEIKV
ncbi:MAG: hypothetical protein ACK5VT_07920 [Alphaproteobacteria bacterium]|jgi:hypothetical protein